MALKIVPNVKNSPNGQISPNLVTLFKDLIPDWRTLFFSMLPPGRSLNPSISLRQAALLLRVQHTGTDLMRPGRFD
jgi:hypothetical protein